MDRRGPAVKRRHREDKHTFALKNPFLVRRAEKRQATMELRDRRWNRYSIPMEEMIVEEEVSEEQEAMRVGDEWISVELPVVQPWWSRLWPVSPYLRSNSLRT